MTKLVLAFLAIAFLFPSVGGAAYCEGKKELFADDFSQPDPSWAPGEVGKFADNTYLMTLNKATEAWADWPSAFVFSGSFKVCAKIKLPVDPKSEYGTGIIFWIDPRKNEVDYYDYYVAYISPNGFYWVQRIFGDQAAVVVAAKKSDTVKTDGQLNEMEISVNDNRGTLIINGQEVAKFKGQPPARSHAGIRSNFPLEYSNDVVIKFSDFKVIAN